MDKLNTLNTMTIDMSQSNSISTKLAAVNNNVRFSIIEILRNFQKINNNKSIFEKEPLYSREINRILLNNYNINITPQMLGQHLKKLQEAELIEEVKLRREVPNRTGNVKLKHIN